MCIICKEAKNKWFHRIVMEWRNISIKDVQDSFDCAFGKGAFNKAYPKKKINLHGKVTCQHCRQKYHIRK